MRFLLILLFSSITLLSNVWQTDLNKAKQMAKEEHKFIILSFSGSDWCGPCIRLHKEIFDSEIFTNYANEHLVLLNADFPRAKKNQLSKEQQKKNDELADVYNKNGVFPFTLLLNSEGKILKTWEGFPMESAKEFTNEINSVLNANK
ncbi:MAG: thioredoxin family protein [Ginsengibacter sp.]|jgi:thioredoxin-related protein